MLSLSIKTSNGKSTKQTSPSVQWRELESNIWKTSKPLNFVSRMWEAEFYFSSSFNTQPGTNPLPAPRHRQQDCKGFEGKEFFILYLSWTLHDALLSQDFLSLQCKWSTNELFSLLHFVARFSFSTKEVIIACHI